jgi:hypothetical protein
MLIVRCSGAILVIGGPALVWYVTPTEEEIFKVSLVLFSKCRCGDP